MEVYALYDRFTNILKDSSTVEHIFIGEINSRGLAIGFHHEGEFASGKSQVIEETRKDQDEQGVYEANVMIYGVRKLGLSSFYPTRYSAIDVLKIIEHAYNNKIKSRLYEASLANGLLIHFYQTDDTVLGKISTAYPKYQK
jgi:hypothetical protein